MWHTLYLIHLKDGQHSALSGRIGNSTIIQMKETFIEIINYRTRVRSLVMLVSDSLTNSCLVNLIDVTLACEDANLKLVEVVSVAEDHVGNSLLQIWELTFGPKAKLLFRL